MLSNNRASRCHCLVLDFVGNNLSSTFVHWFIHKTNVEIREFAPLPPGPIQYHVGHSSLLPSSICNLFSEKISFPLSIIHFLIRADLLSVMSSPSQPPFLPSVVASLSRLALFLLPWCPYLTPHQSIKDSLIALLGHSWVETHANALSPCSGSDVPLWHSWVDTAFTLFETPHSRPPLHLALPLMALELYWSEKEEEDTGREGEGREGKGRKAEEDGFWVNFE